MKRRSGFGQTPLGTTEATSCLHARNNISSGRRWERVAGPGFSRELNVNNLAMSPSEGRQGRVLHTPPVPGPQFSGVRPSAATREILRVLTEVVALDSSDCSGFALLSRVVYFRGLHFLVYGHLPLLSCCWTVFCCCRLFFRFLPRAYRLRSNALGGGRVRVPDISKLTIKSSFTPFLRVY